MKYLVAIILAAAVVGHAETNSRSPREASKHIGETNTVCGQVVSAHYAENEKGAPTFLNLDKTRRDAVFTVVIWGDQRALFPEPPEQAFLHKRVCVTGKIASYGAVPQIVVTNAAQIKVESN